MTQEHQITFGPFRLDLTQGRLWRGDQVIPLRPRSLALLGYLAAHAGRLVSKAEVHAQVWAGTHVTDTVVRVSVREIRAALGDPAEVPRYLETVGRQGYRFLVGREREDPPPRPASLLVGRQDEVADPLATWVYQRTDGNALFMVNIVEHLVQQGAVVRHGGQWTLREGAEAQIASLPEGLRGLLLRRIEALPPAVRRVLEAASVVGETFAVAAVAAGTQAPVEDVEVVCAGLAAQGHFLDDIGWTVWPDATRGGQYRFQHALYQQVLYESLGTAQRVQLHQRIGTRLEAGYGARVGEMATQLAVHFERADEVQRAVHYWQQAGDNAARRHAYPEALTALRKGLALLATLPESVKRTQHELTLLLLLGDFLIATQGLEAPGLIEVYTRAHTLCHQVGEPRQRFQALQGLYRCHLTQAQLHAAGELVQQLTALAQRQHDADLGLAGQAAVGAVALLRGDLVSARAHLTHYLSFTDPPCPPSLTFHGGHHLRITYLAWLMQALWILGYADQAQQRSAEALALA
jgi:DNA-binding winged helix-turn-helix (wHTH) protein